MERIGGTDENTKKDIGCNSGYTYHIVGKLYHIYGKAN